MGGIKYFGQRRSQIFRNFLCVNKKYTNQVFRKRRVWQEAKDLAVDIYWLTEIHSDLNKDFRFRDQIRSSAASIASNIAERNELSANKQCNRRFYILMGANAELMTQLIIAKEMGYLGESISTSLLDRCDYIGMMLVK